MTQDTIRFKFGDPDDGTVDRTMKEICDALEEKGYDPVVQLCGYFLSHEPVYITSHKRARMKLRQLDFYSTLERIVRVYLEEKVYNNEDNKEDTGNE